MAFAETKATERFLRPPRLLSTDYLIIGTTLYGTTGKEKLYFSSETIRGRIAKPLAFFAHLRTDSNVQTVDGQTITLNRSQSASHRSAHFIRETIPDTHRLTGDSYNYHKRRLPITDYTVAALSVWPKDRLIFASPEAEGIYVGRLCQLRESVERSKEQADFKLNGTIPESVESMENLETETYPLKDYQKTAVALALNRSYALFMEQGTGKTAITISLLNVEATKHYKEHGVPYRVLVVMPAATLSNWEAEFDKFCTVPYHFEKIRGSKAERIVATALVNLGKHLRGKKITVGVISYDSFKNDVALFQEFPWDRVIYDESDKFKSSSTSRWKAIRKFRDHQEENDPEIGERLSMLKTLCLTGTPIVNSPLDLYTQWESLGFGESGFVNWKAFTDFHARYIDMQTGTGGSVKKFASLANVPLYQERIARICFRITCKEAGLNLPDRIHRLHEVEMTKKQTEIYDKLATQLFAEVEETLNRGGGTLEISNVLTKLLRLAQITSGHIKFDDTDKAVQIDPHNNPKIKALMDLLLDESRPKGEKTIIWSNFVPDIEGIAGALDLHNNNPARQGPKIKYVTYYGKTSPADKEKAIHAFNNDTETKVFISNPQSGGAGINLLGYNPENPQDIGETHWAVTEQGVTEINHTFTGRVFYFSRNWSMRDRLQSEARCHRLGTKIQVEYTDLLVPNTIDGEIISRVAGKKATADALQDVNAILKRLQATQK